MKVALVVGNGRYASCPQPAALATARMVAETLDTLGCNLVDLRLDIPAEDIESAFDTLLVRAGPGATILVYLCGLTIIDEFAGREETFFLGAEDIETLNGDRVGHPIPQQRAELPVPPRIALTRLIERAWSARSTPSSLTLLVDAVAHEHPFVPFPNIPLLSLSPPRFRRCIIASSLQPKEPDQVCFLVQPSRTYSYSPILPTGHEFDGEQPHQSEQGEAGSLQTLYQQPLVTLFGDAFCEHIRRLNPGGIEGSLSAVCESIRAASQQKQRPWLASTLSNVEIDLFPRSPSLLAQLLSGPLSSPSRKLFALDALDTVLQYAKDNQKSSESEVYSEILAEAIVTRVHEHLLALIRLPLSPPEVKITCVRILSKLAKNSVDVSMYIGRNDGLEILSRFFLDPNDNSGTVTLARNVQVVSKVLSLACSSAAAVLKDHRSHQHISGALTLSPVFSHQLTLFTFIACHNCQVVNSGEVKVLKKTLSYLCTVCEFEAALSLLVDNPNEKLNSPCAQLALDAIRGWESANLIAHADAGASLDLSLALLQTLCSKSHQEKLRFIPRAGLETLRELLFSSQASSDSVVVMSCFSLLSTIFTPLNNNTPTCQPLTLMASHILNACCAASERLRDVASVQMGLADLIHRCMAHYIAPLFRMAAINPFKDSPDARLILGTLFSLLALSSTSSPSSPFLGEHHDSKDVAEEYKEIQVSALSALADLSHFGGEQARTLLLNEGACAILSERLTSSRDPVVISPALDCCKYLLRQGPIAARALRAAGVAEASKRLAAVLPQSEQHDLVASLRQLHSDLSIVVTVAPRTSSPARSPIRSRSPSPPPPPAAVATTRHASSPPPPSRPAPPPPGGVFTSPYFYRTPHQQQQQQEQRRRSMSPEQQKSPREVALDLRQTSEKLLEQVLYQTQQLQHRAAIAGHPSPPRSSSSSSSAAQQESSSSDSTIVLQALQHALAALATSDSSSPSSSSSLLSSLASSSSGLASLLQLSSAGASSNSVAASVSVHSPSSSPASQVDPSNPLAKFRVPSSFLHPSQPQ